MGLTPKVRDAIGLTPEARQAVFQVLENAVREILPHILVKRRRTGLAKRALAALSGSSVESLGKALQRASPESRRREPEPGYVELIVDPPLNPIEGRVLIDLNLLQESCREPRSARLPGHRK
jgi:hypothetical protein